MANKPEGNKIMDINNPDLLRASRTIPDAHLIANIIPNVARALLGLIEERGHSSERLCMGLGFTYKDLLDQELLLSHQQTRTLILRAQELLGDVTIGLAAGARQTPVSWGLPGLAMLTCETFGEAMTYAMTHQHHAGAMLGHQIQQRNQEVILEAVPRLFDLPIEPYLIEESFSSAVAVTRYLVDDDFKPLRIDFNFEKASQPDLYMRFFRCPVRFNAGCNRMVLESHWLSVRLRGYDRITCGLLRQQLNTLLKDPVGQHDLVESLSNRIRTDIENRPNQSELAREVNMSERTLRRRLKDQTLGYRSLRDGALYERASDLLQNTSLSISEIAHAIGYSDARAFRRAFKRWAGKLPSDWRKTES